MQLSSVMAETWMSDTVKEKEYAAKRSRSVSAD